MTPQWTGLLVVSAVASVLSVLVASLLTYAIARSVRSASSPLDGVEPEADGESAVDPAAGVVRCPDCGTENELGYRFCRSCVAELPGAVEVGRPDATPLGRTLR